MSSSTAASSFWLEPFDGLFAASFEVIDHRFDAADDSVAYAVPP